jgi:hypothetical protein
VFERYPAGGIEGVRRGTSNPIVTLPTDLRSRLLIRITRFMAAACRSAIAARDAVLVWSLYGCRTGEDAQSGVRPYWPW